MEQPTESAEPSNLPAPDPMLRVEFLLQDIITELRMMREDAREWHQYARQVEVIERRRY